MSLIVQNEFKNCVPVNHDGKIIDPLVRRRVNAYVEQLRRMTELVQEQEIEIEELRAQLKTALTENECLTASCKAATEQLNTASEQEPFAWHLSPRYEDGDGYIDFTESEYAAKKLAGRGWKTTPLYTQAKPAALDEQEKVENPNLF